MTLVHGNRDGIEKIVADFVTGNVGKVSKAAVEVAISCRSGLTAKRKLKDPTFCVKEVRSPYKFSMRFVLPEVREEACLYNTQGLCGIRH